MIHQTVYDVWLFIREFWGQVIKGLHSNLAGGQQQSFFCWSNHSISQSACLIFGNVGSEQHSFLITTHRNLRSSQCPLLCGSCNSDVTLFSTCLIMNNVCFIAQVDSRQTLAESAFTCYTLHDITALHTWPRNQILWIYHAARAEWTTARKVLVNYAYTVKGKSFYIEVN